ncbi:hypothetical protein [Nonomuraea typhae]|uniref:CD-NTase-associated protein 16 NUDIX domain-containing protein n=1 Tax=Nonomuraea typhae TaxID=2603600 RepID=A0ABW7Z9H5_9ACTN
MTVRISFSALLRIKDDDGYVLFHSPNRPSVYGPPGGVFKYYEPVMRWLERLGFREDRFPSGNDMKLDLRGFLPTRSMRAFHRWFESGAYREDAAECLHRELVEEVAEVGLPGLAGDVRGLGFAPVRTVVEGPGPVPGKPYRQVRRFEIHDLLTTSESGVRLRAGLVEAARDGDAANLILATAAEIAQGRAGRVLVAPQSAFLIGERRLRPDLPPLS